MATDDQRRSIGKVTSVAADRFIVELHRGSDNFTVVGFDDVHYVARLGSFVVIPAQSEYVVAEVIGLWEKDPTASRVRAGRDEMDRAASAKFLELVPVGMLPQNRSDGFRFGVSLFPSLYADALYVLDDELDRIFEVANALEALDPLDPNSPTRTRALSIGTSVVFKGYDVKVRLNEFFGGHVAVLGNTGSGKSCTVASILQSLFDKRDELAARGATFVLLDVNGEYREALKKLPAPIQRAYLHVSLDPKAAKPKAEDREATSVFRLPHWFMSVEEWELLLRASERTQQPVLRMALGMSTLFSTDTDGRLGVIKNHIIASCIRHILGTDAGSAAKKDRITAILSIFSTQELNLGNVRDKIQVKYGEMTDVEGLTELLEPLIQDDVSIPNYANAQFDFEHLEAALDLALLYEEAHGNGHIRDYCAQMVTRFKWIREREEFGFLRVPTADLRDEEKSLDLFVENLLGVARNDKELTKSAQIIILDMNDASDEVVEVVSAVATRLIFDRLRKADPRNRFPVHLILEEAHRYVAERPSRYAIDASQIFERVAKEGRKYGIFLLVASQRPSELSKTVLSQCSNFVVHRIQNPDDLAHIRQMTPFISESVMKRLPSLPKQHALIFGNSVNLPTTFKVRDVDPKPKSDDAAIGELWFRTADCPTELRPGSGHKGPRIIPAAELFGGD